MNFFVLKMSVQIDKNDVVFGVDRCRWTMTDKGKLVRCKYTIPQCQFKKIMEWCESNIILLTDEEIKKKTSDVIKTFDDTMDVKEMKLFIRGCAEKVNEPYDVEKTIRDIYNEFGEVITTIELKRIYELLIAKK